MRIQLAHSFDTVLDLGMVMLATFVVAPVFWFLGFPTWFGRSAASMTLVFKPQRFKVMVTPREQSVPCEPSRFL